ncbi:MAG TPA: Gmad2 immunoglobulin-like domain-containing protein [Acidimicrobiales bacterium]
MTRPTADLEERLAAALRAEAAAVDPGEGSLEAIRRRARAARVRRRAVVTGVAAAAAVVVALAVPSLDRPAQVTTGPGATSGGGAADVPAPGERPPPATAASPRPLAADLDQALWPDPSGDLLDDPVAAARSFAEAFLPVDDPPLSPFREGEPGAGEVDVRARGEDGRVLDRAAATISLRRLDGEHWFVTAAGSPDVRIDSPEPLAEMRAGSISVEGAGVGHEGTIVIDLRMRSAPGALLGQEHAVAASRGAPSPFALEVPYVPPREPDVGVLVARTDAAVDGGVPAFAVVGVRLPGSEPGEGGGTGPGGGQVDDGFQLAGRPLWPFRTRAEADAWLATDRSSSPWHADPEATAVFFATGYLGFAGMDAVTSRDVRADEAWIGVGYAAPAGGEPATAAVVHLRRFGPAPDAPWEVVGTRDSALTLDTPRYGAAATSPLTVGGTLAGDPEGIGVAVHQPSTGLLGERCCVTAAGGSAPWEASVTVAGARDPALTVVVWTGGEGERAARFAVTAVIP